MMRDCFGTDHSSENPDAIAAFEMAVHGIAAHRPSSGEALGRAMAADPGLVAGHALKGFANVMLAREELVPAARQAHADARAALSAKRHASSAERALTEALGLAAEGRLLGAADRLDTLLAGDPRTFLAAKIAHSLRFMAGDVDGMLRGTARVIDAWSEEAPGYGYLLGCHAFALEETGDFAAAERVGRRAVGIAPDDAWGLHAVSHVHEMQGRVDEGIAWIEGHRPVWAVCNNFSFHMAWHLALFHLERGEHERVLSLYDTEVRPAPTDDFRDMANAVSLLWRLRQEGVEVGDRWEELRAVASRRRTDTTLAFACLHYLVALVAGGDREAATALAGAMRDRARLDGSRSDQAAVLGTVGGDLARVILAFGTGRRDAGAAVGSLARQVRRLGGSHAQRDVFLRILAQAVAETGNRTAFEQVLAVRRRLKQDDRYARVLTERLEARSQSMRLSA
ncbi:MAG TPA: tetratricopeptide repeat protein [Microvirga sp.]|jgi:hypothetical protein|nr:tetratricopeptide repeat protein [Microvirga sp.]